MIELNCAKCGLSFSQDGRDKSGNVYVRKFCSRKCANSRTWSDSDKEARRVKSDANKELYRQKREQSLLTGTRVLKICELCGEQFEMWASKDTKFCSTKCCNEHKKMQYGTQRKIENIEIESKSSLKKKCKNWQQWRTHITRHAKKVMGQKNDLYACVVCGYSTYNEICHLKPVSDFDENSMIGTINRPDNLVYMCPTHHWEFDHGIIDINTIRGVVQ